MPPRIDIAAVLGRVQVQDARSPEPAAVPVPTTPLALLQTLRAQGRGWHLAGDHLYVDVTTSALPLTLLEALRQQKEALLTMLEWFEERAGMLEYDGGLARAEAERDAWKHVEERYGQKETTRWTAKRV